jgi:hypothetical protein
MKTIKLTRSGCRNVRTENWERWRPLWVLEGKQHPSPQELKEIILIPRYSWELLKK